MASTLSSAQLYDPLSPQSASLLSQFAQIHSACILNDHTIATFLPPLSLPTMVTWWEARAADAESGSRKIIYVLSSSSSGEQDPSGNGHGKQEVAGVVMLCLPSAVATGPHRAMVEKLLVSPDHRRKGVAKVLMGKLEEVALELGRTNLVGLIFHFSTTFALICSCSPFQKIITSHWKN